MKADQSPLKFVSRLSVSCEASFKGNASKAAAAAVLTADDYDCVTAA